MAEVLVLVEHVDGTLKKVSAELITAARALGEPSAVVTGPSGTTDKVADALTEAERPHEAIAAVGARLSEAMDAAFAEHGAHAHVLGPPSMPTFLFAEPEDEARFFAGAVDAMRPARNCRRWATAPPRNDELQVAADLILRGSGRKGWVYPGVPDLAD